MVRVATHVCAALPVPKYTQGVPALSECTACAVAGQLTKTLPVHAVALASLAPGVQVELPRSMRGCPQPIAT